MSGYRADESPVASRVVVYQWLVRRGAVNEGGHRMILGEMRPSSSSSAISPMTAPHDIDLPEFWMRPDLSKSQVSRMAEDLDGQVEAFRSRRLDAGPYTFLVADALETKAPKTIDWLGWLS